MGWQILLVASSEADGCPGIRENPGLAAWACSLAPGDFHCSCCGVYHAVGVFAQPVGAYVLPVTAIALVCTLVETLPTPDLDNITITVAALVMGHLLF